MFHLNAASLRAYVGTFEAPGAPLTAVLKLLQARRYDGGHFLDDGNTFEAPSTFLSELAAATNATADELESGPAMMLLLRRQELAETIARRVDVLLPCDDLPRPCGLAPAPPSTGR